MTPLTLMDAAQPKPGVPAEQIDAVKSADVPDFASLVVVEDVADPPFVAGPPDPNVLDPADLKPANVADPADPTLVLDPIAAPVPDQKIGRSDAQLSQEVQPRIRAVLPDGVELPLRVPVQRQGSLAPMQPDLNDGATTPPKVSAVAENPDRVTDKVAVTVLQAAKPMPVSFVQAFLQEKMPGTTQENALKVASQLAPPAEPEQVKQLRNISADVKSIDAETATKSPEAAKQTSTFSPLVTSLIERKAGLDETEKDELKIKRSDVPPEDAIKPKSAPALPPKLVQTPIVSSAIAEVPNQVLVNLSGDVEIVQSLSTSDRAVATSSPQIVSVGPSQGGEIARQATHQIAQAVIQHQGRATEIALNPEELGRVRLSMTAVDAAITLTVAAERPETADLLRRHIDVLTQEFRALGYDDITFSFGSDGQSDTDPDRQLDGVSVDAPDIEETPAPPTIRPVTGLDLRL